LHTDWIDSSFVYYLRWYKQGEDSTHLKNDIYFLSYQADTNGSIGLTTALLRRVGDTNLKTWGGFNFTMKYYPPGSYGDNTKIITKTISVPTYKVESSQDSAELVLGIAIAGPRTTTNPLITGFPDTVVLDTISESVIAAGGTILTPQTFTGSYTLLAGDYSPTNLASSISQLLVNNFAVYPQLEGDIVSSQFLKQASQIPSDFPDDFDPVSGESLQRTQIFLKGDGTMMNQYIYIYTDYVAPTNIGPPENYIFGANQIALEWDPELLRFKWTYIHQPFYDSKGNEAITYIKTSLKYGVPGQINDGQTYAPVSATGGVCFSDLSSTYTDSNGKIQTYDFWENVLGFDLKTLIPSIKHNLDAGSIFNAIDPSDTPIIRVFYNYEMSNVIRGASFTSNFLGLDSVIDKLNYKMTVATLSTDFTTTSTFTYAIVGNRTYNETSPYGYFLLEVNAGFNNQFITETEIRHNIQAIIRKYYSQASYTTGSEGDSIVYTHLAETPIYLNTIKIRILNADGTLATDIDSDSTIFLKLVKDL